jgi:hypothetical protein
MHFIFFLWSKSVSQTRVIMNQQLNLHHGAESFMCSQQLLSLLRDSPPFMTPRISLPHAQELREMNLVHFLTTHFLDWFNPDGNCTFHQVFNVTKLCILHTTPFIYVFHVILTIKVTLSLHTLTQLFSVRQKQNIYILVDLLLSSKGLIYISTYLYQVVSSSLHSAD